MRNKIYIIILITISFLSCTNKATNNTIKINKDHGIQLSYGFIERIDSFPSKYIKSRPVDIWLPNKYSEDKKYSVVYMHDGQMLFDSTTTWNKQEWKVDEWANKLIQTQKTEDFIVVGIHNISELRWQDLFPQKAINYINDSIVNNLKNISGKSDFKLNGDNYLKFIVEELKPFVDNTYAVNSDRAHTYVMGSSMGGLMSMYALSEYPNIFSKAACLSTHWVGAMPTEHNPFPKAIFSYIDEHFPKAGKQKIYFDYGNKTLDAHYTQYASTIDSIFHKKGYNSKDFTNRFFEGKDHSENAWNERLDIPLTFLLEKK